MFSACRPFIKNKERLQKLKETGDLRCIYQNELDKFCFQLDKAYGASKDLPRRTPSDKVLSEKRFAVTRNPECDVISEDLHH